MTGPASLTDLLTERVRALDVALHTVEVVVDGEVVESAACAPLTLDTPHRMYSVSKTVTALAVGLLAGEGLLSLDDLVVSHFGDQRPVHPWQEQTTLEDLLTMRGPHRSTTFKRYDGPWLESWFQVAPTRRPGTVFTYDTSGSYLLAALVERTTGTSLVDYLRPRLLDPIGAGEVRFLPGGDGFSHGGSGLVCSPRDLRRIAQVVLDGGRHQGRELLPAAFVAAMTARHADTTQQPWGGELRQGYGYQTWLPVQGGWLMFGLGGQLAWGDPDSGTLVVVTADTQACPAGDQRLIDALLGDALPRWSAEAPAPAGAGADAAAPERTAAAGATEPAARVELRWPAPRHDPAHARAVVGRWTTHAADAPADLSLDVAPEGGTVASSADGWTLPFRPGEPVSTSVQGAPAVVTAGWSGEGTLDLRCMLLGDELATIRLRLVLTDDGLLTVASQGFGEDLDPRWQVDATLSPSAGNRGGASGRTDAPRGSQ